MIRVDIAADVPDAETLELLLVAIRTFDRSCPGCHFKIDAIGGKHSVEEMKAMLERVGVSILHAGRKQ
jgi:hypothetical protein